MKVQQAYQEWAVTYDSDRNLTRDLDQQVTVTVLGSLRFESVLEIGCGTGKNTALLAGIARRVHAIDRSAAMIARAKEKSPFDNVIFTVADISQPWPCRDRFRWWFTITAAAGPAPTSNESRRFPCTKRWPAMVS